MTIMITTYSYSKEGPPDCAINVDAREWVRGNPASLPAFRDLTGFDLVVAHYVLHRPGIRTFVFGMALALSDSNNQWLAIGSEDGLRRAPVLAEAIAARLRERDKRVSIQHREIPADVVSRTIDWRSLLDG